MLRTKKISLIHPKPLPRIQDYVQRQFVATLTGPADGISGVTYSPKTDTVFAIRNVSSGQSATYEYSLAGVLLRTITHLNLTDTEGICWMYGDTFALSEENPVNRITVVRIVPGQTTLDRNNHLTTSYSSGLAYANLGIEGCTYDPVRNWLYFITEKSSAGTNNTGTWSVHYLNLNTGTFHILFSVLPLGTSGVLSDMADIYYDPRSKTFFILSEESDKVVQIDYTGRLIGQLAITGFTQPEGLSFSPDMRYMFVTGEPRQYGRYQR